MNDSRITYNKRTFSEIQVDLISMIQEYYPDVLSDFTDSSIGSILIDLNAGVTNNLSVNMDRVFQETQIEYAQQRESILSIARTMGFNIPNLRPSITVVNFTVTVPVNGNEPDYTYYPTLNAGAQVVGGGKVFETQEVVDWSLANNSYGSQNRTISPNYNSNGIIESYNITKQEIVLNGKSSVKRIDIQDSHVVPFLEITLPEADVIGIDSVIMVQNIDNPTSSDFANPNYKFYEVEYLAEPRVFIDDPTQQPTNGIKAGIWIETTKKFLVEYTSSGYCKLTFGGGDTETQALSNTLVLNNALVQQFLLNTALGVKLSKGYTLFIKYRRGGGSASNVGAGVLNSMGTKVLNVGGSNATNKNTVARSLTVNNIIPAMGGNDGLTIEQIRNLVKYNFSAQNRCITTSDYLVRLYKMPSKYGSPFMANVFVENNKIVIPTLGLDSDGKLSSISNSLINQNIAEYLSKYRVTGDYVEIRNGRIFNLAYDISVFVADGTGNDVINNIIRTVGDMHDIKKHKINEDLFIGDIQVAIASLAGIYNVLEIKVYNKVGGQYSTNSIEQSYVYNIDPNIRQIQLVNNTVYSTPDSMFEIKYPERDIRVTIMKKN